MERTVIHTTEELLGFMHGASLQDPAGRAACLVQMRRLTLDASVQRLVDGLERQLREVRRVQERLAVPTDSADPSATHLAGQAAHEVIWGLANLDLDGLARAAAEFDLAEAALEQAVKERQP